MTENDITVKKIREADIPAFAEAVVATRRDITAVGDQHYVLGDADLSDSKYDEVQPLLQQISRDFGDRDHLRQEIVTYLHSIGRSFPPPQKH